MPSIKIENRRHEMASDTAWTVDTVELSSGDIYVDDVPFGTYIAACYPESRRPPNLIVTAINTAGSPTLSIPFEYRPELSEQLKPLASADSPWTADGVITGPIPEGDELSLYTMATEVRAIAAQLVLLEPILCWYAINLK